MILYLQNGGYFYHEIDADGSGLDNRPDCWKCSFGSWRRVLVTINTLLHAKIQQKWNVKIIYKNAIDKTQTDICKWSIKIYGKNVLEFRSQKSSTLDSLDRKRMSIKAYTLKSCSPAAWKAKDSVKGFREFSEFETEN